LGFPLKPAANVYIGRCKSKIEWIGKKTGTTKVPADGTLNAGRNKLVGGSI
jgi:hypothetical protein